MGQKIVIAQIFFYIRALFVDHGGALIPWMGDPNQPIDRYDGRATIHNLKPFESLKDNLEPKDYLTEEEVYNLTLIL